MVNTIKKINLSINSVDAIIIDGIIMLLGLTVLTQFFSFIYLGFFSAAGISIKITDIAFYFTDVYWVKMLFVNLLQWSEVIGPLLAVGMLITGICLILLIYRYFFAILAGSGYLLCWILLWHFPGTWTFEFLFPALFGFCSGFANLNKPIMTHSFFYKLQLSKKISIALILVSSIVVWYVTYIAFNEKIIAIKISVSEALLFLILTLFHLSFGKYQRPEKIRKSTNTMGRKIADRPWLEIIIIMIGAMMVMQVYADYFTGLYTLKGYSDLVGYYAVESGARWFHPFLLWSNKHSALFMPLQIGFEIAIAILLPLLILSGPILALSGLFFGILTLSELGVSATWPPTNRLLTWEWELLLVTSVSLLIGFGKIIAFYKNRNWRELTFGRKLFQFSNFDKVSVTIIGGLSLYLIGIATQIFGDTYKIISFYSGITFLILFFISVILDKFRV